MQVKDNHPQSQNVQSQVKRVLRWFNQDDELVDEVYIENADLVELQELFAVSAKDPMYDCYLVETEAQRGYLEKCLKIELHTDAYDYFLECDAEGSSLDDHCTEQASRKDI